MRKLVLHIGFLFLPAFIFSQVSSDTKTAYDNLRSRISRGERGDKLLTALNGITPRTKTDSAYYSNMEGAIYLSRGKKDSAQKCYETAVKLFKEAGFKKEAASALNDIGNVCLSTNDLVKALSVFQESVTLYESIGEKKDIAGPIYNMGIVYYNMGDADRCEKYVRQAIPYNLRSDNKQWLVKNYAQLAVIFMDRGNKDSALYYSFAALRITKKCNDPVLLGFSFQQTGIMYGEFNDLDKAKIYFDSALAVRLKNDDQVGLIGSYGALGELMMGKKKLPEAKKYILAALEIANARKYLNYRNNCYRVLFNLEERLGNYKDAFMYYKLFTRTEDSLHNENLTRTLIDKEYRFNFEKKEAALNAENEKQKLLAEEDRKKQKIITYSISAGLLLVAIVALVLLRSARIRKQVNRELSEKNALIVKQQAETERQKELIEVKQKEIIDSIQYAKRIQQALITSELYIERVLNNLNSK